MTIKFQLNRMLQTINHLEQKYHRCAGSVKLIAVSKTRSVNEIEQAIQAGQRAFAESYLQESLSKIAMLNATPPLEWHFIGRIQSNKTKPIAEIFDWVHSVERYTIAESLNRYRPINLSQLNVCLQMNISEENTKAGLNFTQLHTLAQQVALLPRLKLRGLMAIPAPGASYEEQCASFHKLRMALVTLNNQGLMLDSLSMGMSDDYEAAIAEGATMLRLGTAIFGPRSYAKL